MRTGVSDASFYSAGIPVYITWEWGPEMSTVWKEGGSFDWWEVDAYLRKLAALDPNGRLHLRFNFGPPPDWWAAKHPDDLVQTLTSDPNSKPQPGGGGWRVASFASKPYWEACERAARDLGRYVKQHPEGWRVLAVTYSGGGCEFFPHWGEGRYSDYSPAFLAAELEYLQADDRARKPASGGLTGDEQTYAQVRDSAEAKPRCAGMDGRSPYRCRAANRARQHNGS